MKVLGLVLTLRIGLGSEGRVLGVGRGFVGVGIET